MRPPTLADQHPMLRCIGWGCAAVAAVSLLIGQNIAYSTSPEPVPVAPAANTLRHDPATISYDTVDGHQVACLHQDSQVTCIDIDDHQGNARN